MKDGAEFVNQISKGKEEKSPGERFVQELIREEDDGLMWLLVGWCYDARTRRIYD